MKDKGDLPRKAVALLDKVDGAVAVLKFFLNFFRAFSVHYSVLSNLKAAYRFLLYLS